MIFQWCRKLVRVAFTREPCRRVRRVDAQNLTVAYVWYLAPDHHAELPRPHSKSPKDDNGQQFRRPAQRRRHRICTRPAWDLRSWSTRRPAQGTATGQSAPFIPSGVTMAVGPAPLQVLAVSPPLRYSRRVIIPRVNGRNAQTPAIRQRHGERVNSTRCCPSRLVPSTEGIRT
jgi:hypothetical protein